MPLCTATEYKAWRGVTSSGYDTLYGTLIDTATAEIERLCGRTVGGFISTNGPFTETFDGDGTQYLRLSNGPISSITSIKYGNSDQTTIDSSGYTHDGKHAVMLLPRTSGAFLQRDDWGMPVTGVSGNVFPIGFKNVEVVYAAGYADTASVPDDLKLVCYRFVDHYAESRGGDMEKLTEAIGNTNVTVKATAEFSDRVLQLLAPWRPIL
jgi:hypothetical protein